MKEIESIEEKAQNIDSKVEKDNLSKTEVEFSNVSKIFRRKISFFDKIKKIFFEKKGSHGEDFKALDLMSFSVLKGNIHGFIGSNGSGKTTTFMIAAGVSDFDEGFIKIRKKNEGIAYFLLRKGGGKIFKISHDGKKVGNSNQGEWNENISYVFSSDVMFTDSSQVYSSETVIGYLKKISFLRNISKEDFNEKIKKSPIFEVISKRISELSLGWKKILQISIVSLFKPKAIFLDEPFNGLDPFFRSMLIKNIMDFRNNGGTIVISTHIISDLEKMADSFTIISKGKVLFSGKNKKDELNYIENSFTRIVGEEEGEKSENWNFFS